jgi:hypothetical protein
MLYVSVLKNQDGEWYIAKIHSSTINVRGNVTGTTWGDISKLDLATRLYDGFWIQDDKYENTGEFMQFKEKTIVFDEVAGVVTNTYIYELMDLDVIKQDLKGRVDNKRENVYNEGFEFQGNMFMSGINNRNNIQLMMIGALIDEDNFPSDLVWDTVDNIQVSMDLATFKLFVKALTDFTRTCFITARSIKSAIDSATDYTAVRAAASWDGEAL